MGSLSELLSRLSLEKYAETFEEEVSAGLPSPDVTFALPTPS